MAVSGQRPFCSSIDHEKLAEIRDYEYPNTVKGHSHRKRQNSNEDFYELYQNFPLFANESNVQKTAFYDGNLRRI